MADLVPRSDPRRALRDRAGGCSAGSDRSVRGCSPRIVRVAATIRPAAQELAVVAVALRDLADRPQAPAGDGRGRDRPGAPDRRPAALARLSVGAQPPTASCSTTTGWRGRRTRTTPRCTSLRRSPSSCGCSCGIVTTTRTGATGSRSSPAFCLVIRFVRVAPPRFLPDLGYIDLATQVRHVGVRPGRHRGVRPVRGDAVDPRRVGGGRVVRDHRRQPEQVAMGVRAPGDPDDARRLGDREPLVARRDRRDRACSASRSRSTRAVRRVVARRRVDGRPRSPELEDPAAPAEPSDRRRRRRRATQSAHSLSVGE